MVAASIMAAAIRPRPVLVKINEAFSSEVSTGSREENASNN
jgi:hypothetical protein